MIDHCDMQGAQRLGAVIAAYWAKRGMIVRMEYVDAPFCAAMRSGRVDIRSNMVNGVPRKTPAILSTRTMDRASIAQSISSPIPLD